MFTSTFLFIEAIFLQIITLNNTCEGGKRIKDSDMISYCMYKMVYVKYQNGNYTRSFNEEISLIQVLPPLAAAWVLNVLRIFSSERDGIYAFFTISPKILCNEWAHPFSFSLSCSIRAHIVDTFGNHGGKETTTFPPYSCMNQPHSKILHTRQEYKLANYEMLKEQY